LAQTSIFARTAKTLAVGRRRFNEIPSGTQNRRRLHSKTKTEQKEKEKHINFLDSYDSVNLSQLAARFDGNGGRSFCKMLADMAEVEDLTGLEQQMVYSSRL
jgi:hypothetical protein